MTIQTVTDAICYVGVDDNTLALFENQYSVQPMGVSYNSYVILDEKIAVMDSVDARAAEEWLSNVARVLEGRSPDYLVVTHMEPDHSGSLMRLAQKYPEMKIVGNAKTFTLIKQFFGTGAFSEDRMLEVGERDTLSLGLHRLRFLLAPMVHWPEVMAAYEEEEKILFSADAFGRFGSLERTARAPWAPQARRYYYNIVGKYGAQVQALLKKISALEIKTICPLHGPMLTEDLGEYLRLYDLWSQWKPEKPEGILIAHASIHGNTAYASEALKSKLNGKGAQVTMCDLTATDLSYAVTSAFYCGKLVLACSTYDGGLFPTMKTLEPKRAENKAEKAAVNGSAEDATVSAPSVQIDLSKVKIEPLFADDVDFETFSKSDFRVVKIEACEAVPKSKKLLKFTLNDGTDRKRTILSGIHEYYEPEELVGKTCVAITNLPPRKMMGIDSEGMLISAVYEYDGREGLNLLMLDDSIPAGAKLY
jgi:methionine--tRNA ligase beta chain